MSRKSLFKYSSPTQHAFDNLMNCQVLCQHFSAYNDPFEFWSRIVCGIPQSDREPERYLAALRAWGFHCRTINEARSDPAIQESVDEYFEECNSYVPPFEEMRRRMRISCFSSKADNLLMWSHYADGLRGFCLSFDEDWLVGGSRDRFVVDVVYDTAPPKIDSFIYGIAWDQDWYSETAIGETEAAARFSGVDRQAEIDMYRESGAEALRTMRSMWQSVFATKPIEWKYELERRLLVQTTGDNVEPVMLNYPPEAVTGIVMGERMPDEYRCRLVKIIGDLWPGIETRTARRAGDAYTLTID